MLFVHRCHSSPEMCSLSLTNAKCTCNSFVGRNDKKRIMAKYNLEEQNFNYSLKILFKKKIYVMPKLTILVVAALLVTIVSKAQIPDKVKNFPAFKLRSSILSSLHKPHEHGILHDMKSRSNAPCLKAQNTLGGTGYDFAGKLIATRDGGFIVCGGTNSADGDFSVPAANGNDAYIAKYNKSRHLEWTKTFGGTGDDFFNDIVQTNDGGYFLTGYTSSTDGDVSGNHGAYDVWAVKVNTTGKMEWQKCLGGSSYDFGNAVVQTSYGGYAIAGFTGSNDGNVSGNHNTDGSADGWLVVLGLKGNVLYQHCYGGSSNDDLEGIVKSDFGSLILAGSTSSNDGDVTGNHGGPDAWVIKVNLIGKIVWQKTVGGSGLEFVNNGLLTKTTDENVVTAGYSNSHDGDIQGKNDTVEAYVTKLNAATGNIIWSKSFAEPKYRNSFGVFATSDGGVVQTGASAGNGFDNSTWDVLVSKINKYGTEEWYKKLGGSDFDGAFTGGYESPDGSLNILCLTASSDGDVKNNHGAIDTWIIKLGRCGDRDDDVTSVSVSPNNNIISNTAASSLSAYPNPVVNAATISFSLQQAQKVSLQVFDMSGKLINKLAEETMQPGHHQVTWNATDNNKSAVAAGIYLLKLQTGNNIETKKISVVR